MVSLRGNWIRLTILLERSLGPTTLWAALPPRSMPTVFPKSHLGPDRVNGFYETPLRTVAYMCRPVLAAYRPGRRVLDPSAGDGVFLHYLLGQGVRAEDLHGFDIDAAKVAALQKTFPHVTVFDATDPFPASYHFIVGNPPYNGDDSHWVRDHRARLQRVAEEIGAKNTYSIITYQAIRALVPGGQLSLILADSFLTNIYYRPFREFLLRELDLNELLLAPRKLFHQSAADVRTCILTATKRVAAGGKPGTQRVRLVNRVQSEEDYAQPASVELIPQEKFRQYPDAAILIGLPAQIRELYLKAPRRLGDIAKGGTGISTGNDKRFLRPAADVQGDPAWVPYYKNGARQPYWYSPDYYIGKDFAASAAASETYLVRNKGYFFKPGITCSSVGVRFSAAYLPPGALFGVNANFFFDDTETLYYALGLLNSRLAWYFARMVLVRSNNISANYLRKLPYLEPAAPAKKAIARKVRGLVQRLQRDGGPVADAVQQELNSAFNAIYGLNTGTIRVIDDFCANFYDRL